MARYVEHFESHPRRLHHVAFLHHTVGRRTDDAEAERRAQVQVGAGQERRIVGADDERGGGERLLHRLVAGDMVGVAVRIEDRRRR